MERHQQIGIGLPVQRRYARICFEKEHVADSLRAELVSPGHPLLQACRSLVTERDGAVPSQGAVLVDEGDLGSEPRLLFCLEHGLQDGRRTRSGLQQLPPGAGERGRHRIERLIGHDQQRFRVRWESRRVAAG